MCTNLQNGEGLGANNNNRNISDQIKQRTILPRELTNRPTVASFASNTNRFDETETDNSPKAVTAKIIITEIRRPAHESGYWAITYKPYPSKDPYQPGKIAIATGKVAEPLMSKYLKQDCFLVILKKDMENGGRMRIVSAQDCN